MSQVAGLGPAHPLDATEKAGGAWGLSDRARRRQCLEPSLSPHRARQGTLHSHYGALPVGGEWLLRAGRGTISDDRSEEYTSELKSLMRTLYAVICLKKKQALRQM